MLQSTLQLIERLKQQQIQLKNYQWIKKVTVIEILIPKIPKKFPCLDVSGEESPLKAKINNTPEIK